MGFVLNCSGRDNTLIARSKGFGCTVPELEIVLLDIDLEKVFTADRIFRKQLISFCFNTPSTILPSLTKRFQHYGFMAPVPLLIIISWTALFHLTDHSQLLSECWQMRRPVVRFGRGSVTGKKAECLTECSRSVKETLYTGDLMHPLSVKLS
ncbi:hypothetical protein L7Q45_003132 [Citrobacter braakii]|uniref:hypothetical protein n=1 Tax=Citrobacter TaxID=544 RepID=UPI0011EF19FB|nr:hypothetical protein [Citrobacter sp. Cb016]EIV2908810.1 hypothetical protein [Citrobacter braakii]EKU7606836.1 hypothetical protein [Citrobacter freundii]EMC3651991.1 hypothetical protein [Citrobacter braakii]KAA0549715.1 hypothetical protein F0327_22760 [Citrobacter braakii]MDM3398406.1 hypothetical protein [Citrobacter sp. Cb016]